MNKSLAAAAMFGCLLVCSTAEARGTARLVTSEAAEVIDRPVLGLQRSAVPLFAGVAVDTSLIADLALLLNVGLRYAGEFGPHRLVVGARYSHFVGAEVYTQFINGQAPPVKRFEPALSGPAAYAVVGTTFGKLLVQLEAKGAMYTSQPEGVTEPRVLVYAATTLGVSLPLGDAWAINLEGGARLSGGPLLKGAAGIRFTGQHFGFSAGAAYLGLSDPILPLDDFPIVPAADLWWTF